LFIVAIFPIKSVIFKKEGFTRCWETRCRGRLRR